MSTETPTGNTIRALLVLIAVLLAVLTLLTAADLSQDAQPFNKQGVSGADRVGYAVDNPALQEELHARIMAPAIKEGTPR